MPNHRLSRTQCGWDGLTFPPRQTALLNNQRHAMVFANMVRS